MCETRQREREARKEGAVFSVSLFCFGNTISLLLLIIKFCLCIVLWCRKGTHHKCFFKQNNNNNNGVEIVRERKMS